MNHTHFQAVGDSPTEEAGWRCTGCGAYLPSWDAAIAHHDGDGDRPDRPLAPAHALLALIFVLFFVVAVWNFCAVTTDAPLEHAPPAAAPAR